MLKLCYIVLHCVKLKITKVVFDSFRGKKIRKQQQQQENGHLLTTANHSGWAVVKTSKQLIMGTHLLDCKGLDPDLLCLNNFTKQS